MSPTTLPKRKITPEERERETFADLRKVDNRLGASQITKGKGYLRIDCSDEHQYKLFSSLEQLGQLDIQVSNHCPNPFAPKTLHKVIVFAVNEDTTSEEILEELSWQGCVDARRLGADDGRTRPVVLTFKEPPPEVVRIGLEKRRTTLFIPRPIRCHNCQRFGHIKDHCRSVLKCAHCAGKHLYNDCPDLKKPVSEQVAKCGNCGESHSAAFRECKSYLLAAKITTLKTKESISYAAAAAKIRAQPAEVSKDVSSTGPFLSVAQPPASQKTLLAPQASANIVSSESRAMDTRFEHVDLVKAESVNFGLDDFPPLIVHVDPAPLNPSNQRKSSGINSQSVFNSLTREALIGLLRKFVNSLLEALMPEGHSTTIKELIECLVEGINTGQTTSTVPENAPCSS